MRRWLEDRNRRALLILSVAIVVFLFVQGFALPLYDSLLASSSDVTVRAENLRRAREIVGRKGQYDALVAAANKRIRDLEVRLLSGPNSARASSELQSIIEETAKKVGINLVQRSALAGKRKDRLVSEVGVTVTFESTPGQLVSFFSELRSAPKVVKVSSAQIAPVQVAHAPPVRGELTKNVRANLTFTGLFVETAEGARGQP